MWKNAKAFYSQFWLARPNYTDTMVTASKPIPAELITIFCSNLAFSIHFRLLVNLDRSSHYLHTKCFGHENERYAFRWNLQFEGDTRQPFRLCTSSNLEHFHTRIHWWLPWGCFPKSQKLLWARPGTLEFQSDIFRYFHQRTSCCSRQTHQTRARTLCRRHASVLYRPVFPRTTTTETIKRNYRKSFNWFSSSRSKLLS